MGKYQLGEFEEIVLLTIAVLHGNAYGVSIKNEIESKQNRKVSVGALQSCLKRLESKGYLKARDGEASSERGGRPKRYVEITAAGKNALNTTREVRNELWDRIPKIVFDLNTSVS